ncbi:hypothetical protein NLG97_g8468 [Lecanicillium saksenae]|uniref:Uncharacterized protein n=1 Tax=Lecanicillium saksenae TaxID=468837 RepID=A0ACC1QIY7_9HYPO|nr:hypothetical protein NLG97_g8468 [Lecanicillium saksenae]
MAPPLRQLAVVASAILTQGAQLALAEAPFNALRSKCPQKCSITGAESGNWTRYHNFDHLEYCNEPMLLSLNVHNPASDNADFAFYACVGELSGQDQKCLPQAVSLFSNNKTVDNEHTNVSTAWSGEAAAAQDHAVDCDSADPSISFAYLNGSYVGVYTGNEVHEDTALDLLKQYTGDIHKDAKGNQLVMQICDANRTSANIVGVAIAAPDTLGDVAALAKVQSAVQSWNLGKCVDTTSDIVSTSSVKVARRAVPHLARSTQHVRRDDCRTITVNSGDSCGSLASRCGIPPNEITDYNTASDFCSTLAIGQQICCNRGSLPDHSPKPNDDGTCASTQVHGGDSCDSIAVSCGISSSRFHDYNGGTEMCNHLTPGQWVCCSSGKLPDRRPKPNADGSCKVYVVQDNDYCDKIAAEKSITTQDLKFMNKKTWGWAGCALIPKMKICVSDGDPPMPTWVSDAECGPQVPGTRRQPGMELVDYNQCKLNACCNKWGHCGLTEDFCTQVDSETGNPGTSKAGTNGCVSNCGMEITNVERPGSLRKVGYFEAFNNKRSCLNMGSSSIANFDYDIIHFAFGTINPDFTISVADVQEEFDAFVRTQGKFKKVISFGGWEFSTGPSTYHIFRDAVQDGNAEKLAQNVVDFLGAHNLDGVDFDWEYPGATDIPGVPPPADDKEGQRYLKFLQTVKAKLGNDKSLSIAAPASYWYLKAFPIREIAASLDYIVYMAYDLHGQWDFEKPWAAPGCKSGSCLRSHVNASETHEALVLITKAGVKTSKIQVGVSSYGRSFKLADRTCIGPDCKFTGPLSNADKGPCTDTAGYISDAEIQDLLQAGTAVSYYDELSDSRIAIYNNDNWVAYMDRDIKAKRTAKYFDMGFGGTTDWAIDLEFFLSSSSEKNVDGIDISKLNPGIFAEQGIGGVDWEHVYCGNSDVDNIDKDKSVRWQIAGCPSAWNYAVANYKEKNPNHQPFGRKVANILNVTSTADFISCEKLSPQNGCRQYFECNQHPAGSLIFNSMVSVNNLYWNTWEALDKAKHMVDDQIDNISNKFAKKPEDSVAYKLIISLIDVMWAQVISPRIAKNLAGLEKGLDENKGWKAFQALGDKAVGDLKAAAESGKEVSSSKALKENVIAMTELFKKAIESLVSGTFGGDDDSINRLWSMIDHGAAMQRDDLDQPKAAENFMKLFYAAIIPVAWQSDYSSIGKRHGVVVVFTDESCNSDSCPTSSLDWQGGFRVFSDYARKHLCHCVDGQLYYLVSMEGNAISSGGSPITNGGTYHDPYPFYTPDGYDKLPDYGFDYKSFIELSVKTWKHNDKKNGWKPNTSSKDDLSLFVDDPGNSPGVVNIPVCSYQEAHGGWAQIDDVDKFPNWPCQDGKK